uniref:Uncharacterized protein n=1 Tax=Strigamia maritima TaxID=126957 RepID=T1IIL9_STRMM
MEESLTQRLVYDEIKLLADIGGNLGLFMGLSLLSITDILLQILQWMSRSSKKNKLDRIENLILKTYFSCKKEYNAQKKEKLQIDKIWTVILFLCVVLTIFMIQERASYYIQLPTRNIVQLVYLSNITFPSITVCGETMRISHAKKKYVMGKNTNWCDVELLDLYLTKPKHKMTLNYLWKSTKLDPKTDYVSSLKAVSHVDILTPNVSAIATPLGDCIHFKFVETEYAGFFSMFLLPFLQAGKLAIHECPNAEYKVFTSDVDSSSFETYDVLTLFDAPVHSNTGTDIRFNVFQRLNIPTHPCVEKTDYRKCRNTCILEQVQKAELCELPFLRDEVGNLSLCESSAIAKKSLKTFIDILSNITKSCSCTRPCMETINVLSTHNQLVPVEQPFLISFVMTSNIAEHIIEVEDYSLFALCADIGNSFGLALGMCVLSFLRYANQPILWLQSKINNS